MEGSAAGERTPPGHDSLLTRDRLDLLFQHCADLDLTVDWADLGPIRRGQYQRQGDIITLNYRLTRAQATATLAHEIGHAEFGDRCSTPANERRAWEYGASLIVSIHEYAMAERMVGHHLAALATELEVTPKLIEAWRRWASKRLPHLRHVEAD